MLLKNVYINKILNYHCVCCFKKQFYLNKKIL